jgi:hypothetical protein
MKTIAKKFRKTTGRWNRWSPPTPKPFRLSGLLFDLAIDKVPYAAAEARIRSAAKTPSETAEAIRRFSMIGSVQ